MTSGTRAIHAGDIEQLLAKTALSVVQIGELLVAAVYALTAREIVEVVEG